MNKLIATNSLYQILAKIITSGTGFIITIILAKEYGVLGYGDFVKITNFIGFFYLFLDLGLNAIFLQQEKNDYKSLFYLRLVIALGILAVANIVSVFLPFNKEIAVGFSPFVRLGIFIFSFSFFNQAIILSTNSIFQRKLDYYSYMKAVLIGAIANLLFVILFAFFSFSLISIFIAFVASGFITAIASMFLTSQKMTPAKINYQYSKKLVITSLPLAIMLIFNLVYFRVDAFILAFLKSTADVGVYGLSYRFFDFLIALPLFFSNALYPFLLENKKNTRMFFNLVRKYLLIFVAIGTLLVIPFWFVSPLFSLIKKEFSLSIFPFRILLLSLPVFFITSLLQWVLIALKKQKYLMKVYILSAIINIVLNLIFIPRFSYMASAIITGVSEVFVMVLLFFKVFNLQILLEKGIQNE
jgi:O-antigen/teichoic acid export membrane protein